MVFVADSLSPSVSVVSRLKLAASCSVDGKIKILSVCQQQHAARTRSVLALRSLFLSLSLCSDLTNGQVRVTMGHDDAVTHIEWANGDPYIFSSSVDKSVRMWDVRSGQCMQTWKGHSDAVLTFCITPDGGTIVTGSDDHTSLVFVR